jgi:hypothetical protein
VAINQAKHKKTGGGGAERGREGGRFRITKGEAKKNGPEAECKGVH